MEECFHLNGVIGESPIEKVTSTSDLKTVTGVSSSASEERVCRGNSRCEGPEAGECPAWLDDYPRTPVS